MKQSKTPSVETKHNQVITLTSNPKEMLSKYVAQDAKKSWTEDFLDENTGEVISIDRYECLFSKGTYITQDVLAKIQFCLSSGDIDKVAISNQSRGGHEIGNNYRLWIAGIVLNNDKKVKMLLYANSINMAYQILTDFSELQYRGAFYTYSLKEIDYITLIDDDDDELKDGQELKYYQIDVKIIEADGYINQDPYIVHTVDTDRALKCIENYLIKECKKEQPFDLMIETSKILPCSIHVPTEFTKVYAEVSKE